MTAFAKFFSDRVDARPLALCRIAIGAAAILRALVTYHLLDRFLVEGAVKAHAILWVPEIHRPAVPWFIGLWLLCALFFTVGFFTRLSGALLILCIAYQLLADQNLFWNHVYFLGLLVLLLTVGNSGAMYSIDWLRKGKPAATVLRWPVTLIKLQVTVLYLFTAMAKINPHFLSGAVLERAFWIGQVIPSPTLFRVTAFCTIALETFLALGLWSRRLQRAAFPLGLVFHTLVLFLIGLYGGLVVFGVLIVAPYLLYLQYDRDSRTVVWDERFPPATALAVWLRRLDWLGAHRFRGSDTPLAEGLELRGGDRTLTGFEALAEILAVLPLGFLWAPVLGVPPLRQLGALAYRAAMKQPQQALRARASG